MSIVVASVRGIKTVDGEFTAHKVKEETYADSPDIDALVETKPKGKSKKTKAEVVEPEVKEEETSEETQDEVKDETKE